MKEIDVVGWRLGYPCPQESEGSEVKEWWEGELEGGVPLA